ncbi:MAG: hypothetical protein R2788_14615 [Saprospiraceae bacterium]
MVNNAGYGAYGPLEAFRGKNILRQFNTNVIGLLDDKSALPHFRKQKWRYCEYFFHRGGNDLSFGDAITGQNLQWRAFRSTCHENETDCVKVKIVQPGMIATDFAVGRLISGW